MFGGAAVNAAHNLYQHWVEGDLDSYQYCMLEGDFIRCTYCMWNSMLPSNTLAIVSHYIPACPLASVPVVYY